MDPKVWNLNSSDSIQCQQLTVEYLNETITMMDNAFFHHENVCRAIGLSNDPAAILELRELTATAAKDGVTIIAVDKTNNKVVGAAFNKIQVKNDTAFEHFEKSWKQTRSKYIVKFMADIDNLCDLFELCQVDCLLELMFLGTLPEYRGKGIAKRLCEATIDLGRTLANGINVKKSVDGKELGLEPAPKIISSIFTSFVTQKIGKQLGFQVAAEKRYEEFEYDGKSFTAVIGNETPSLTLEYKLLSNSSL